LGKKTHDLAPSRYVLTRLVLDGRVLKTVRKNCDQYLIYFVQTCQ
jgi:hypothetical protein